MFHKNQTVIADGVYLINDEKIAHQYICQSLIARLCLLLFATLFVIKTACADIDIVFPAGEYELETNVSLPNLQTNLANTNSRQLYCLHQHQASE